MNIRFEDPARGRQAAGLELVRFHTSEELEKGLPVAQPSRGAWNAFGAADTRNSVTDAGTYPNDNRYPIVIGAGFDQLRNRPAGSALRQVAPLSNPNLGARTTFQMRLISSASELRTTFALSAGASASAVTGGGSGRAELYRETKLSRFSNFVMIMVTLVYEAQGISDYDFKDDDTRRLYLENPQGFYDRYGTEFISSVIKGGEFIAIYELHSETRTEYEAQRATLSTKVGIWSTSADASASFSEITNYRTEAVKISRLGPTDALQTDPAAIVEYARQFSTKVTPQNAATLFFSTQSYARAADGNHTIKFIPALNDLAEAVETRDRLQTLQREWRHVQSYPEWFGGAAAAGVAEQRIATIDAHLDEATAYIASIQQSPFAARDDLIVDEASLSDLPGIAAGDNLPLTVTVTRLDGFHPVQQTVANGQWTDVGPILNVNVDFQKPMKGLGLEYFVHIADHGDQGWVPAGTPTRSWSHQGIGFRLTGPLSPYYSVRYRAHLRGVGQTGYVSNEGYCGTRGEYRPIVQLLVEVVKR